MANSNNPFIIDENFTFEIDFSDSRLQFLAESFAETNQRNNDVVVEQPRKQDQIDLPVYTLGWTSVSTSQIVPESGLDFLYGVEEVEIIQTVLNLRNPNSDGKRYLIRVPKGETLYAGLENSSQLQRDFLGSQRSFFMTLTDPTHQYAAHLKRNLGCTISFCYGCLQSLEVIIEEAGKSRYIGKVALNFALGNVSFSVFSVDQTLLFTIYGPRGSGAWTMPLEASFKICKLNARVGEISREWKSDCGDFVLTIKFPAPCLNKEHKMLLIGGAMLIEYMYYEHRKTSCLRIC